MKKTLEFLKNLNISLDDYIIVGCSGGPDSMCLLNLLYQNKYKIVVAHVNHNIRTESEEEYKFVEDYCKKRNIIFEGLEIQEKNKNEAFYRTKRYNFYKELAKKYKTNMIATAHHGDDLIETILMRITRGSNLRGYIGFSKDYVEYEFKIIKPLIFYTKEEILNYNKENDIPFVIDKTNEMDTYTRNRYRHKILPFLKRENKSVHQKYLEFSEELESACKYIEKEIQIALKENYSENKIALDKFLKLDEYIQKKELETILKSIYKDDINKIKKEHIESILQLAKRTGNASIDLPNNIIAKKEYKYIYIIMKEENLKKTYDYIFKEKLVLEDKSTIEKIENTDDTSNYTIRLNSENIKLPLHVRSRLPKDKMYIKNLNGSKTIKKIMIDEKVPSNERDTYPLVTDDENNILWLPGIKKSKFDNEISEKYDIILKYIKEGKK